MTSNYLKDLSHTGLLCLGAVIFDRQYHGVGRGDEGAPVYGLDNRPEGNFRGKGVTMVD